MKTIVLLFLIALFGLPPAEQTTIAQDKSCDSCELRFKLPDGWVSGTPASKMRVAQFKLPRTQDDAEDASLVVYYFGASQGGSVEANIDRWVSQIEQPGGGASKDKAKLEALTINGLKVTTVEVAGTYTAEMSPGSATRYNKPKFSLRGAVIETSKGLYFAKLVSPEKTVGHWHKAFNDFINSVEFK